MMELYDFNGTDVYVITEPHNWMAGSPDIELSYPSSGARTLTGLEVRRPQSIYFRISQSSSHVIADQAVPAFRAAVADRRKEPVLMPAWGLGADYADGLPSGINAPLQLVIDSVEFEVIEDGDSLSFTPGADAKIYPLLWGDFVEDPDPVAIGGRCSEVKIQFIEKGRVEYALSWTVTLDAAISLATRAARLWPFMADWTSQVRSGKSTVDVFEESFRKQRDSQKTIYSQLSVREYEMGFSLFRNTDNDDICEFLTFLQTMQGLTHSFWLPTFVDEATVVSINGADVTVDDASILPTYLAIYDREQVLPRKIDSTASNTITLNSTVAAINEDDATLCALRMCRLASDTVKLKFSSENAVEVGLRFVETPNEADPPAGETYGTTMGGLLYEAHLFEYTIDALGNVQQWHYTDHPESVDWNSETWLTDLIEFKGLTQDDTLEVDEVQITGRVVDGHPFALFVPWKLESPLQLTIYRTKFNPDGSLNGTPTALTSGEVSVRRMMGELVEAELQPHRKMMERRAPSFLIQRECNYSLFSAPCGLSRAAWQFSGELLEYIGGSAVKLRLENVARVGGVPLPSVPVDYFRGGWIQVGSGAGFQWRHIVECTNVVDVIANVDVVIAYPFNAVYSVGQVFSLYPGCSGAVSVCRDKFSNFSNYGGCPHVPESNPTLREHKRAAPKTSGGKK